MLRMALATGEIYFMTLLFDNDVKFITREYLKPAHEYGHLPGLLAKFRVMCRAQKRYDLTLSRNNSPPLVYTYPGD